jgi:hypothetical protein
METFESWSSFQTPHDRKNTSGWDSKFKSSMTSDEDADNQHGAKEIKMSIKL